MSDTFDAVARLMTERHASMTPEERMLIGAGLFEAALTAYANYVERT